MVTIYNIKKSEMLNHPNGEVFYLLELRGLSTDEKPTTIENGTIENGSVFIEIDTQEVFIYDGENETWLPEAETQDDSNNNINNTRELNTININEREEINDEPIEESRE